MTRTGQSRTAALIHQIAGQPEVSCRVAADPPFVIERHRVLLETTATPPAPAPVIIVHTGGKAFSYRTRSATDRTSLPGLVTFLPTGVRAELALRGIGEGLILYFDSDRRVPDWLGKPHSREPLTFVDNLILSLAQQLLAAATAPGSDEDYLRLLGNALLAQLRHALKGHALVPPARGSRSALLVVHRAIRFIQDRIDGDLSVGRVARHVGVGTTHFTHVFREATGVTPHRYVLSARVTRARELLRMTSLTVAEVSISVGFAGQAHFSTAFRRQTGVTPTAYRQSCRAAARRRA
ncbi:MAG TPA: AraC family transcriptional regulator [Steroidobacteraceae bacterium]|nr:AraC family transcriptional regulator [Steroidobacteraceae bacterium]